MLPKISYSDRERRNHTSKFIEFEIFLITVGCALVLFLHQTDLLPQPSQRLVAITLLHDLYASESKGPSPFDSMFVQLLVCVI